MDILLAITSGICIKCTVLKAVCGLQVIVFESFISLENQKHLNTKVK